jgi:hypothetical protein
VREIGRGILGDIALCGRDRDFGAETAVYAAPRLPDREAEHLMSFSAEVRSFTSTSHTLLWLCSYG